MFALLSLAAFAPPADPFVLQDGDRVVWIGSTVVEREQRYGYWETALHAAFPDAKFTVRNLGWSGDTVFGDSRAGFDTPKEGFKRLVGLTLELKPTVILVSYGTNEAFDGAAGVARFETGLNQLLDALAPAKARVVLLPPLVVTTQNSTPAEAARVRDLNLYTKTIRSVGEARGLLVGGERGVRTPPVGVPGPGGLTLTDNGIHLTEAGYRITARSFVRSFCDNASLNPDLTRLEPLRKAITAKNELFFHRWRPQNETYLFGFRKHEQGKNAKEVAEFDPLVDKADKEIARIKTEVYK